MLPGRRADAVSDAPMTDAPTAEVRTREVRTRDIALQRPVVPTPGRPDVPTWQRGKWQVATPWYPDLPVPG
jgi:hypothetical protein